MKAVLTNFGTTGDFRPLLTLAEHLSRTNLEPVLAFPQYAESFVRDTAFQYRLIGPNLSHLRDRVNLGFSEIHGIYDSDEMMFRLFSEFAQALEPIYADLKDACRGADVLISGPAQPMARMVHETTGIPFVSVQFDHLGGNGGPGLRRAGDKLINPFRLAQGLRPLEDCLTVGANSDQLAIYAMTKYLRPRPTHWTSHFQVTGFFFDDMEAARCADSELQDFLQQGSPPLVVSLGSMVRENSNDFAQVLIEGIRIAGVRAVIQGMSEHKTGDSQLFWTSYVPHTWLFPKAACVILHGGAGTTAATLRAGIPGIFIPHGDCYGQRYWAQSVMEAGCAVPAIPYHEVTAAKLAAVITETLNSNFLRQNANSLGAQIRREPGVRMAVHLIQQLLSDLGLAEEPII